MTDIKGKWALLTGASRGIGRLSAVFMAKQGVNLVLHSRSRKHCQDILNEVKALGVEAYCVEAELSEPEQIEAMCAEIDAKGTPVDIILNNAGLQIAYRTEYLKTPASDYDISFRINTTAPMMICYHFLPAMERRGFGRIVNTTSGIDLEPEQAGYSGAKAALNKVTRDLGLKYQGTDITLNLTDPGWCRTDLGGPSAPNAPESAVPGCLAPGFVSKCKSGRIIHAQDYVGLSLDRIVEELEQEI